MIKIRKNNLIKLIIILCLNNINYNSNHFVNPLYIFIHVHGTYNSKEIFFNFNCFKNIYNLRNNKNLNSLLEKRTEKNKPNEKYQDIATNKLGLNKVYDIELSQGAQFLLNEFNRNLNIKNYEHYVFGWSGLPCSSQNEIASKELYESILKLIKEKNNNNVKIILIGTSFGGNICLGISNYLTEEMKIPIEYLFTIGCPFYKNSNQKAEKKIINSNQYLFKNIFNIKSNGDKIQKYFAKFIINNKKITFINTERENYNNINFYFESIKQNHFPGHRDLTTFDNKIIPVTLLIPEIIQYNENKKYKINNKDINMYYKLHNNELCFHNSNSCISFAENYYEKYQSNAKAIHERYYIK